MKYSLYIILISIPLLLSQRTGECALGDCRTTSGNDRIHEKATKVYRSHMEAAVIQVGIRLKWLYLQWGGFKPLLLGICEKPSPWRPQNAPKYDYGTSFCFTSLWTITGLTRDKSLRLLYAIMLKTGLVSGLNYAHQLLIERVIQQFVDAGIQKYQPHIPLPEFEWQSKSPDDFYHTFVALRHPAVLRGFMNNTSLLEEFSWKNIMKKYSEEDVYLTKPNEDEVYLGKIKEAENPETYVYNVEILFNKYNNLRYLFEHERIQPYLKMDFGYEQLFLGRNGTGSPFHHAAVWNMFYQVDGIKRWSFVDPYDSFMAYPAYAFGRPAAILQLLWPHKGNLDSFPAFAYCPVYTVDLEPGDVLFIPPMWWHAVDNLSPTSVGVASRWHTNGVAGHNLMMTEEDYEVDRFASMAFMLGPSSIPFMHGLLRSPSPLFDEQATMREINNRYVNKQMDINRNGGMVHLGIKTQI